jgi:hypothetical protein
MCSHSEISTFGQRFAPFPTIAACPRAAEILISRGICWLFGFEIPSSTSGPVRRPQIVEGITIQART